MKRFFLIAATAVSVACNKKVEKDKVSAIDSSIIKLSDTAYVSVNKGFLDEFKDSKEQTFIFTPPKNGTQPIRGTKHVGAEFLSLFPPQLKIGNTKKPEVFAVEKFKVDKNTTALITQNPGDYSLTSLNLILYNHRAEAVSALLEVADETGDAGYFSKKQTVLVKDSGKIKGLMWFTTSIEPVDNDDPTHPVKTNDYFSVQLKNGKIDTAKATKAEIARYKGYFK